MKSWRKSNKDLAFKYYFIIDQYPPTETADKKVGLYRVKRKGS